MANIGVVTLNSLGHLNPMMALAQALKRRGHTLIFFHAPEIKRVILDAGFNSVLIDDTEGDPDALARHHRELGQLDGLEALRFMTAAMTADLDRLFLKLPWLIRREKIDAMLIDQVCAGAATVAEFLKVPFVSVANALMINHEIGVPPIGLNMSYARGALGRVRNRIAYRQYNTIAEPLTARLNIQRREWKLPEYGSSNDWLSKLAQIIQQPPSFDLPRKELPETVHYVGPLVDGALRKIVEFPWDKLDGRPLVYASMGTLQNGKHWVFQNIAEACAPLNVQLVMSLGGNESLLESVQSAPGHPIVRSFAPQLELIKRASLVITHAGLNTALESLAQGVPMVAIPVTSDQPGVATRIAWSGTGIAIPLGKLTAGRLRSAIRRVLAQPRFRENATRIQTEIAGLDSLESACTIVERAFNGDAATREATYVEFQL